MNLFRWFWNNVRLATSPEAKRDCFLEGGPSRLWEVQCDWWLWPPVYDRKNMKGSRLKIRLKVRKRYRPKLNLATVVLPLLWFYNLGSRNFSWRLFERRGWRFTYKVLFRFTYVVLFFPRAALLMVWKEQFCGSERVLFALELPWHGWKSSAPGHSCGRRRGEWQEWREELPLSVEDGMGLFFGFCFGEEAFGCFWEEEMG